MVEDSGQRRDGKRYGASAITAAVTGGDVLPSQSRILPKGVEGIVAAAVGAATAGATCVHLHARDDKGRPSSSPQLFAEIVAGIRERSDVVINITTGGSAGMNTEERLAGVRAVRPDIATFNLGTMNYEGFPTRERWPEVETDWEREVLERSGSGTFVNTLDELRAFARELREIGVTPELEAYDLGHLSMARFLAEEGTLAGPLRIQLVLGVLGGAGNSLPELFHLQALAPQILGPHLGSLGVAAVGYPMQLRHAAVALSLGMDCRVGLEDNLRLRRDREAESNAELVEAATTLADLVGRPVLTPAELREQLGPWRPSAS